MTQNTGVTFVVAQHRKLKELPDHKGEESAMTQLRRGEGERLSNCYFRPRRVLKLMYIIGVFYAFPR